MYTLRRRVQASLIIPIVFLIVMTINLIAQDAAYNQAISQGLPINSTAPFDIQVFAVFLGKLVIIYFFTVLFFSVETLIRVFITDKDSPQSLSSALAIKNAPLMQKIRTINSIELAEGTNKITHSVLFQIMMIVLTFFAVTSSDSIIGRGITLGILVQVIIDQALLLKAKQGLSSWFWQFQVRFPIQLHQIYFVLGSILSLLCIFFALR
jgi:hypothetical protein